MTLLTKADVAACLKISKPTVHRLIAAGRLRVVRVGRSVRVSPDDLAAFIDSAKAAPDPDASGPRAGVGRAA